MTRTRPLSCRNQLWTNWHALVMVADVIVATVSNNHHMISMSPVGERATAMERAMAMATRPDSRVGEGEAATMARRRWRAQMGCLCVQRVASLLAGMWHRTRWIDVSNQEK
jgi:hypothetical protein